MGVVNGKIGGDGSPRGAKKNAHVAKCDVPFRFHVYKIRNEIL